MAKKWMQQAFAKNQGKFSASAKRAHKSTLAYANAVLKNPKASTTQKRRANLAKTAIKISRSRKKKG
jgi:hypothetical protein